MYILTKLFMYWERRLLRDDDGIRNRIDGEENTYG